MSSEPKPVKLIMSWDIRPETETEYFEFLVHEFIPGITKLGINDIQVWLTIYGDSEQKLTSGIANSSDQMRLIMRSKDWKHLTDKLEGYVDNFSHKVIHATRGFQI